MTSRFPYRESPGMEVLAGSSYSRIAYIIQRQNLIPTDEPISNEKASHVKAQF